MEDPANRHRWHGFHLLILAGLAWAAPLPADLQATVHADGHITGTLRVPPGTHVVDLLSKLPAPRSMRRRLRTFPGKENLGIVHSEEVEPGVFRFETELPRRFGGIGRTHHGLYAHGGFYPQPLVDGAPPVIAWTVTLDLPGLGLVGTSVGTGVVRWSGTSDRVTLALPRHARAWTLNTGTHRVVVLGKRRPRRALWRHLGHVLPSLPPLDVVLAEAPLRRRLFRTGTGSSLVSDRIFRLTLPFQPFHRPALVEGLLATQSQQPTPPLQELVGWTRAQAWMQHQKVGGAAGFTRFFSWVPSVDSLLSSRRIPFYREIFREIALSDTVHDDLQEVLQPHRTGAGVSVQIDDTFGRGSATRIVEGLEQGLTLSQSFQLQGYNPRLAEEWVQATPDQDYVLSVGPTTTVQRQAPTDAPIETVVIAVDGVHTPLQLAPGEIHALRERPDRIRIDPGAHIDQTSRTRDAWPVGRLRVTATSWTDIVNLTRFRFIGGVAASLRGRYDTRNRFTGSLSTDRRAIARLSFGYTYKFGPLLYGITRHHRLRLTTGAAWIDPTFQSIDDGRFSVSGRVGWSYSNNGGSWFPVRGYGFGVSVAGQVFPDGKTRQGHVSAFARGVTSPHPRHAFAGRIRGESARATREDLLLTLGGPSKMRSLPVLPPCGLAGVDECAAVVTDTVQVAGEYRVAFLRGLSVPLGGVYWASEYQLTLGMEGVAARGQTDAGVGLGVTAGLAVVYDNWGAEPMLVGFTAGWPVWGRGLDLQGAKSPVPEIYLRFGQAL